MKRQKEDHGSRARAAARRILRTDYRLLEPGSFEDDAAKVARALLRISKPARRK